MEFPSLLCGVNTRKLKEGTIERLHNLHHRINGDKIRKHLPIPSGQYSVGCVDLMSDPTREGVFIRLYYPTEKTDVLKREIQWPLWLPRKEYGKGYAYFRRKNTKVFGTMMNMLGGDVHVPVLWQAKVLRSEGPFPVIIFSHGLGGNRTTYSTLCSDIASQGFIVAAIEHRDGSASMTFCLRQTLTEPVELSNLKEFVHRHGGFQQQWLKYERQEVEDDFHVRNKQVYVRAQEMKRVLDFLEAFNNGDDVNRVLGRQFDTLQLKGLMDMSRVSVVGHSFGGATTVATLAKDPRFKVGVALDSWMLPLDDSLYQQVEQPVLFVNTDTFQWETNVRDMFKLDVNKEPDQKRVLITIKGTCHQSVSDFQFLVSKKFGKFMEMRHSLKPSIAMEVHVNATLGFLWKHLAMRKPSYHDDILSGQNDLVILGTNLELKKEGESLVA